jgi:hypothetical protein
MRTLCGILKSATPDKQVTTTKEMEVLETMKAAKSDVFNHKVVSQIQKINVYMF